MRTDRLWMGPLIMWPNECWFEDSSCGVLRRGLDADLLQSKQLGYETEAEDIVYII